jgi:DNA-binding protein H-NS
MANSYKELLEQRNALDEQIAEARKSELASAVSQVHELVKQFDLKAEDIFPRIRKGVSRLKGGTVAPKYRDTATGSTWTGRGKPPVWIKDKDRSLFLIKG